jgi:Domain of unknown function (DUF4395)
VNEPVDAIDARTDRAAQATVGVVLLAAFVFRVSWVVPVVALFLAVGALAGPEGNVLHKAFERWLLPRLPPNRAPLTESRVAVSTVRAQDALGAVVLAAAALGFVLGIAPIGWVLVLAEAVVAILAATTRVHAADWVRRRL